jgi:hypothetical protein
MGNADAIGRAAGIVDILPGAAGAFTADGITVVIKLQGDADDVAPLLLEQRGHNSRIDPARHGHDDPPGRA